MSNNAERPIPHDQAWSTEERRESMRQAVSLIADAGGLRLENATAIATTYGTLIPCVEAEMMKHMTEGGGK